VKKLLIVVIGLLLLSTFGCSLAIKQAREMDKDLAAYIEDDSLSLNCRAGIADALILAPDTSADIRIAAQGVSKFADQNNPDYIECYSRAAWISFLSRGIASKGKKFIGTYIVPGVLVP
jgi:hypothetical protein